VSRFWCAPLSRSAQSEEPSGYGYSGSLRGKTTPDLNQIVGNHTEPDPALRTVESAIQATPHPVSRRSESSSNPDALDLVMRARALLYRGASRENIAAALELYQQALRLAPDDVQAMARLAVALSSNVLSQ
jgi:tetratricopeptide (TPR) repeat protein